MADEANSSSSSDSTTFSPSTSKASSSSSPSENVDVPAHTRDFDRSLIDKLGILYKYKSPLEMIVEHMSSFTSLSTTEVNEIDFLTDVLGLQNMNFNSLDEIKPIEAGLLNCWKPRSKKTNLKEIDIPRFLTSWENFGVTLAYILKNKKDEILTVSEAKYQCLFERFLQMFGLYTMAQPEADQVHMKILDKKVTSKADIVCLRSNKPYHKRNILAVCEVKNSLLENNDSSDGPVQKRRRISSGTSPRVPCHSNSSVGEVPITDNLLAQHVGQLFAYYEKSVSENGLLGMAIEKTCVTFTQLCVRKEALKKIKDTRCGSVKLNKESRPILYYSKQYNYLNKADRREIVKALLSLRVMEYRRAKKDFAMTS